MITSCRSTKVGMDKIENSSASRRFALKYLCALTISFGKGSVDQEAVAQTRP